MQVAENKRYAAVENYTISEVAERVKADTGSVDILIHSLANGPEVTKPLLETTRNVKLRSEIVSNRVCSLGLLGGIVGLELLLRLHGAALRSNHVTWRGCVVPFLHRRDAGRPRIRRRHVFGKGGVGIGYADVGVRSGAKIQD